jgi:O-antigen ligase
MPGDPSSSYIIFLSSVFFVQVFYFTYSLILNGLKKHEIYFLFGVFFIICWSFSISIFNEFDFKNLIIFIIMGLPGCLFYFAVSKGKYLDVIFEKIELAVAAFSVFFIITVQKMFSSAETFSDVGLAGATYQTLSYTAVLLFGFIYVYLVDCKRKRLQRIFVYTLYTTVMICLFLITVLGGSKGAFLVFFVYLVIIISRSNMLGFFLCLISVLLIIAFVSYLSNGNHDYSILEVGMSRISMLFDSNLSIADRTSGRDEYYLEFLKLLDARPFLGYGIMSENPYVTNTHNLFLMLILQNGFILGCSFSIIYIILLVRAFQVIKLSGNYFYFILIVNVFVMLMFSGQFFANCLFWFTLAHMFDKSGFLRPSIYAK